VCRVGLNGTSEHLCHFCTSFTFWRFANIHSGTEDSGEVAKYLYHRNTPVHAHVRRVTRDHGHTVQFRHERLLLNFASLRGFVLHRNRNRQLQPHTIDTSHLFFVPKNTHSIEALARIVEKFCVHLISTSITTAKTQHPNTRTFVITETDVTASLREMRMDTALLDPLACDRPVC
jgi:hypothetical protein